MESLGGGIAGGLGPEFATLLGTSVLHCGHHHEPSGQYRCHSEHFARHTPSLAHCEELSRTLVRTSLPGVISGPSGHVRAGSVTAIGGVTLTGAGSCATLLAERNTGQDEDDPSDLLWGQWFGC